MRVDLPVVPANVSTHDNTKMSDFAYCRRKYALAHVLKKRKREIAFPLTFGALIHKGLDVYYSGLKLSQDTFGTRNVTDAAEAAVLAMQDTDYIDPVDGHRTKGRAIEVMIDYITKYRDDPDITNILFTETPYDVTLEDGFPWGGIMDLWSEYHHRPWVVDHKTTSMFGQYFFDDFKRSPQFLGYVLSGAALHGEPPAGVLLNVLVIRKNGQEFHRKPLIFPDWLVEECKQMQVNNYWDIGLALEKMDNAVSNGSTPEAACFNTDIWSPNLYNCVGKYGRCTYYSLCEAMPQNRERVLEFEYEDHEWDWREVRD